MQFKRLVLKNKTKQNLISDLSIHHTLHVWKWKPRKWYVKWMLLVLFFWQQSLLLILNYFDEIQSIKFKLNITPNEYHHYRTNQSSSSKFEREKTQPLYILFSEINKYYPIFYGKNETIEKIKKLIIFLKRIYRCYD